MQNLASTAVFIADYTISNSPSILNLLELLSGKSIVDVYLNNVALKDCAIWQQENVRVADFGPNPLGGSFSGRLRGGYDNYIAIDPHGLVFCNQLFPNSRPVYYSLELYLKNDHFGLNYPPEIMNAERNLVNGIKGLIIQSQEKDDLFRADYNLSQNIPTFILPVTYKGPSVSRKSQWLRQKYDISPDKKIALHLGGIAEWFSCGEIACVFAGLKDWVLFFQGYPNPHYEQSIKDMLSRHNVKNVIFSDQLYDHIDDVDQVTQSCDLGIAWYNDVSTGFRVAGKSSGKIPAYMRFGLPIIAKGYPSTIDAIEKTGVGICVDEHIEIADAVKQIESNYSQYSQNALAEYDRNYNFENYADSLLDFVQKENIVSVTPPAPSAAPAPPVVSAPVVPKTAYPTDHFRWDKILVNEKVEDFMITDELWGENQGTDNFSRAGWRQHLKNMISSENKTIRALEIGFGSGIDYRALEEAGILDSGQLEYHGADVTQKFVDYAREHFTKMKPVLVNGYDLPFEDNFFDVVYLRHILEHQVHYKPLLTEIFRVCRKDVYLVFFIALSDEDSDSIRPSESFYHNVYSRKHFYAFVEKGGFSLKDMGTVTKNGKTDQVFIMTRKSAIANNDINTDSTAISSSNLSSSNIENNRPSGRYNTGSDKLSILQTVEFYYPHIGGAELVVQEVSERLAKRGHNVTVATTYDPERSFKELNGVKVEEFKTAGLIAHGYGGTWGIQGEDIQRYQEFLLSHPADVMFNYAVQQWATDLVFEHLSRLKEQRVNVLAPCGYSALSDRKTIRWPKFENYYKKVIPAVIPLYDAVVYHSSQYQDYEFGLDHGFTNSMVIHNGVDDDEFTRKTINFRGKFKITTKYMGLCVGNFYGTRKRQDRIIECVRQMNRPDFTMVLVGKEGPPLNEYKKLAQGLNVRFLTDISREDTVAAYHAADLFLLGSDNEASPLVIIEAKASKTPFVSTDCGNVREWKGGIVCPPERMAHYANRLIDDRQLYETLARDGWNEWKEKLTWEKVVDRYEELYLRLHYEKTKARRTVLV